MLVFMIHLRHIIYRGAQVSKFEKSFSEYIGSKYCIACANGTDSLEILLKALGIKRR